jgi:hypothetical protein
VGACCCQRRASGVQGGGGALVCQSGDLSVMRRQADRVGACCLQRRAGETSGGTQVCQLGDQSVMRRPTMPNESIAGVGRVSPGQPIWQPSFQSSIYVWHLAMAMLPVSQSVSQSVLQAVHR